MENYVGKVVKYKGEELVVFDQFILVNNGKVRTKFELVHEDPELLEKDKKAIFKSWEYGGKDLSVFLEDVEFLDRKNKLTLPKILDNETIVIINSACENGRVNNRLGKIVGNDIADCFADLSDLNYYVKLLEPPYINGEDDFYDVMLHKDEIIVKED